MQIKDFLEQFENLIKANNTVSIESIIVMLEDSFGYKVFGRYRSNDCKWKIDTILKGTEKMVIKDYDHKEVEEWLLDICKNENEDDTHYKIGGTK